MRSVFGFVFAVLLLPIGAQAYGGMKCGNRIVDNGDDPSVIVARCGEPSSTSQHMESVVVSTNPVIIVQVAVEIWFYDFGPHDLIRKLRFENGQLVDVREEGYGTSQGRPAPIASRDD
jgi:hypothetical protein